MKTNEKNEYSSRIATIDEIELSISRNSKVDHSNDHERKKFDDDDDEHERRQKFVVHVVRIMWKRRNEHRDDVVDRVAREFKKTMWKDENSMCEMKQQTTLKCNQYRVDDVEIDD